MVEYECSYQPGLTRHSAPVVSSSGLDTVCRVAGRTECKHYKTFCRKTDESGRQGRPTVIYALETHYHCRYRL